MSVDHDELRARYCPDDVRVLFVGESPPAGGTFFYAADSKLYFATKHAFERALPGCDPGRFLQSFQSLGCYLDDLCLQPVNHLKLTVPAQKRERLRKRVEGEQSLALRLRNTNPAAVVLVMSGIQENVRRAAAAAGVLDRPFFVLPFPGRPEHAARFDRDLQAALRELRERRVLV